MNGVERKCRFMW